MISVQETWLVAHVRARIVSLCEMDAVEVPGGVGDLREWAGLVAVDRVVEFVRNVSGCEWPEVELVARLVLVSQDCEIPLEWHLAVQQAEMERARS